MSVKYIKVRFNTNDQRDRAAMDILKKVNGQNVFIKNAIIAYEEKRQNEQLVETILTAVRSALSNVQLAVVVCKPSLQHSQFLGICGEFARLVLCYTLSVRSGNTGNYKIPVNIHSATDWIYNFQSTHSMPS